MAIDLDKLTPSYGPLFVTRYALNERTAIGVQTLYLTKHFPHFHHLYWNDTSLARPPRGSYRLENWAFCRFQLLRYDINRKWPIFNGLENQWEKTRWSWWAGDKLKVNSKTVLYSLRDHISSVYFAPIDSKDARRMTEISSLLGKPYVVHLWDFLDGNIDDEATQLLIRQAKRVFCLNIEIASEVKKLRDANILEFTRSPSNHYSDGVENKGIRIALIGNIKSYLTGVLKLFEAIKILKEAGVDIKIIYIGKMSTLLKLGLYSKGNIEAAGFIKDCDKRDQILSTCNVGFLPGPGASPELDYRSKFSIPSRILDFLAAGLPVVGHVHPLSATFAFLHDLDFDKQYVCCEDPAQIARALFSLTKTYNWSMAHQHSLKAFTNIRDRYNIQLLKDELVSA